MNNNKIKVNYKKIYGESGTVYNQTIIIKDKNIIDQFNNKVSDELTAIKTKSIITYDEVKKITYLKAISNRINYLYLTQLYYLIDLLNSLKIDTTRILNRNTILILK